MNQEKVLIVEDEENARSGLAELVSAWGFRTETAKDGLEGLEKIVGWHPAVVLLDLQMPRMSGADLMQRLAESAEDLKVIVVTANTSVPTVVELMKLGAYDYVEKPVNPSRLRTILEHAARQRGTERELEITRRSLRDKGAMGAMVGSSRKMQEIFRLVEMVAPSTASVLITGGKRHRQRNGGAHHPRSQFAQGQALCGD